MLTPEQKSFFHDNGYLVLERFMPAEACDRLRAGAGRPVLFVYLNGSRETLAARLGARKGHFMPPSLLDSQLATLEPPGPDEPGIVPVSLEPPVEVVVKSAIDGVAAAMG